MQDFSTTQSQPLPNVNAKIVSSSCEALFRTRRDDSPFLHNARSISMFKRVIYLQVIDYETQNSPPGLF